MDAVVIYALAGMAGGIAGGRLNPAAHMGLIANAGIGVLGGLAGGDLVGNLLWAVIGGLLAQMILGMVRQRISE